MTQDKRYIFDKDKLRLPHYLRIIVTPEIRESILVAREYAGAGFQAMRRLEEHYDQRFHRLCPTDNKIRFENHCNSIRRLFSWRKDYHPHNPTLAPTPKFPEFVFCFHVDENAYRKYIKEHERLKRTFLHGPYLDWRVKAQALQDLLDTSGIAEVDRRYCQAWWRGFMEEMRVWETRFDDLVLPSWEEMIDTLTEAIEMAVDFDWDLDP